MFIQLKRAPVQARATLIALACTLMPVAGVIVAAEPAAGPEIVTPLLSKDLVGIAGKEAVMLTVEYLPGGASLPHRHDANVFVYVLEGSLIMQVQGQSPVTIMPGQTFYETPDDVHVQSANASATGPAKILVFMVRDKATQAGAALQTSGKARTQPTMPP